MRYQINSSYRNYGAGEGVLRLSRLIMLTLLSRRMERITEMEGVIGIWQR